MDQIKVTLLGVTRYSFPDRESGRIIEGTNAFFIQDHADHEQDKAGFVPVKTSLPLSAFEGLKDYNFPCECMAELKTNFTGKGVVTKILAFKPITK